MKTLLGVLLLTGLALAVPSLDLSALDRPGLPAAQQKHILDQAYRRFTDPVSHFEVDCLRAEALFRDNDPAVCQALDSLRGRVANIPPGQARARYFWLLGLTGPASERARCLREALAQPGVEPVLQMKWLRVSSTRDRAQREWIINTARALADRCSDEFVQIGWLDILARDAGSKGLIDQQRSLVRARVQIAEKIHCPEEQTTGLFELKSQWSQVESVIFKLKPGPRRDALLLASLWHCPDLKAVERFCKATSQRESLAFRSAYCEWYWLAADRLGLDPERGITLGRKLLSDLQAAGEVEKEIRFRTRLARELQIRGKFTSARQQLAAAYQLRTDNPWADPTLLRQPARSIRLDEAYLLRQQGCDHQALALLEQLLREPDLKPGERDQLLYHCQQGAIKLGDQESLERHWLARLQLVTQLPSEDRCSVYEDLLRELPATQQNQRPPLLRLAREAANERIAAAEAGHQRIVEVQRMEHLLELQKDTAALQQLWNRELDRARGRDDDLMVDWAGGKLLQIYFNARKPDEFKALAKPWLASSSISQVRREEILGCADLLARVRDPLALIWVDELVDLSRKAGDRARLASALERRARVKWTLLGPEAALKDIEEAVQLEPARSRSFPIVTQASILAELGRTQQAVVLLKQDIANHLASASPQLANPSLARLIAIQAKHSPQWREDCARALARYESLGEACQGARDQLLFEWLQQLAHEQSWEEGSQLLRAHAWKQASTQDWTVELRGYKPWQELLPAAPLPPSPKVAQATPESLAFKLDELRLARPELGQWLSLRSTNLKHLQAHLGAHDTLVTYAALGDDLYVLVVRAHESYWVNRQVNLERATRDYLAALSSDQRSQAEIDLHSILLEPVLKLDPNQRLLLVPTGNLWQVPFGALRDPQGASAASQAEIVLLSSGDLLRLADNDWQPYRLSAPLAIGAPPAADLPGAFAELGEVSQVLPDCRLRRGEQATLASLREGDQPWGLVHFASHARYNRDRPTDSNIELHDGNLRIQEISRLPLAERSLVALSCCQGGSSDRQNLEEPVTLATSFAAAGADTVVGNLWRVDDEVARLFFRSFYQELSGGATPAHSFRQAQLTCRGSYPKTRDWGGFFLLGNPN